MTGVFYTHQSATHILLSEVYTFVRRAMLYLRAVRPALLTFQNII